MSAKLLALLRCCLLPVAVAAVLGSWSAAGAADEDAVVAVAADPETAPGGAGGERDSAAPDVAEPVPAAVPAGTDPTVAAVVPGQAPGQVRDAEPAVGERVAAPSDSPTAESAGSSTKSASTKSSSKKSSSKKSDPEPVAPFEILGETVEPGETRRVMWPGIESFVGAATSTPIVVAHGTRSGEVLCLTSAVHGDELSGIEITRRVLFDLDPTQLAGTLVGVPIVNIPGFERASRYLPDRRDLNRYFPGDPAGSSASRMAHALFEQVVRRCHRLIDLHTGSFHRTNLTQLRADLSLAPVRELAGGMGDIPVLHSPPALGTLRRAASDVGIPSVTMEAGEPMRLDTTVVERGVDSILGLMGRLGMLKDRAPGRRRQSVFYKSTWVRAERGGILVSEVALGQRVKSGEQIGTVTDPITNVRAAVYATESGTVLGMAVNQFVMPGFALYRIGITAAEADFELEAAPGAIIDEELMDEDVPAGAGRDLSERPE